ncbi:MAG: molybdenum cofactor biosynthesis protein MoaE [Myxococcota bacterium]
MLALTHAPIDVDEVQRAVLHPSCGAVLLFLGTARDHFEGRPVQSLHYEAYEEVAVQTLAEIAAECAERWPNSRTAIVHRLGGVPLTEPTVVIATATPHRPACYAANRYALEQLKARVAIWKKEIYQDGSAWKENAEPAP